eukprot:41356_1
MYNQTKNIKKINRELKKFKEETVDKQHEFKDMKRQSEMDTMRKSLGKVESENKACQQKIDKMKEKMNIFKQQTCKEQEIYEDRIAIYNGTSKLYHTLDMRELNSFESELQCGLKEIKEAKDQLIENKFNCVICQERHKNICFMDGCSHIVLCDQCEKKMDAKQCPICCMKYTLHRKVFI